MHIVNEYSHLPFLTEELKEHIKEGTFAGYMWRNFGDWIHLRYVESPDLEFDERGSYCERFSVRAMYSDMEYTGPFDCGWLAMDDGSFITDDGTPLPEGVVPKMSVVEQVAAYSLWLITEELPAIGELPGEGEEFNENGFPHAHVIEHRAECMLLAYQGLALIHKLLAENKKNDPEIEKAVRSALATKRAQKRHEETNRLKREAESFWVDHIDKTLSNDAAADLLKKQLPLTHRTLSRYVGEFKKRHPHLCRLPAGGTPF
jgi:hypothetical protein